MSDGEGVNPAAEEQISKWLDVVWRIDPKDYVEVENFRELPDGARVQQDSIFWADKFFTEGASPYHPGLKVRRSIHRATPETFDTVRHEYDTATQHLLVEVNDLQEEATDRGFFSLKQLIH